MTDSDRIYKLEEMQEKNQTLAGQILESIIRLERIVVSNSLSIEELTVKLDQLENKKRKIN